MALRICFLSRRYFPTVSGISVYADNLVRQMVALGHDITMLSQYYGGATAGVYGGGDPPGIPGATVVGFEAVNEQDGGNFEGDIDVLVREIERRHDEQPFDLLHAQYGYPTGYAVLIAAQRLGLPSVVSIQGGDGHWVGECCGTHRDAMRAVCLHADSVIIGSSGFARQVAARLDVPEARFTVIPGAVDTGRFHPPAGHDPATLHDPVRLLYHGRVDARKGVLELLDAFEMLQADGRSLTLRVSGIGPDQAAVEARCAQIPNAEATGPADYAAAPDVYRDADLFLSPTHAEGFSNTILEAMATGLPIVSCDAVGVRDCLEHERDALLCEVSDVAGLADQPRRLLDDADLRTRLAGTALQRVRDLYAWPVIAGRIADLYAQLTPERSASFTAAPVREPREACIYRDNPPLL